LHNHSTVIVRPLGCSQPLARFQFWLVCLPRPLFRPPPDFCLSDLAGPNQWASRGCGLVHVCGANKAAAQCQAIVSKPPIHHPTTHPIATPLFHPPSRLAASVAVVAACPSCCCCNSCSCKPQQRQLSVRLLHRHPESRVLNWCLCVCTQRKTLLLVTKLKKINISIGT